MILREKMRCHKVRQILRYHTPHRILFPDIFCFYFFSSGILLSGLLPLYQSKIQEQGVQNAVNVKKMKSEPYGDVVDQVYSKFNETLINNQDPRGQIENMKI